MRFYTQQHKHYCGIDLHARKMYVCIVSNRGKVKVHQNIKTDPELFFELVFVYLDDLIVGVECVFCWYWLADFCAQHHIPVNLDRCLVQTLFKDSDTHDRRRKTEPTSRLSRNLI